jgi:hypothetical protein
MPLQVLLLLAVSQPTVELHVAAIAGLIGVLLPLVTGVFVKKYADRAWAAVVTLLLSVVTGAVAAFAQSGAAHIDWVAWVFGIITAYVAAIASYYGIHVPTGLAGAVQNATANFGLGSVVSEPLNMTSAPRIEQLGSTLKGGRATPTPAPVPRVEPKATPPVTRASGQSRPRPKKS